MILTRILHRPLPGDAEVITRRSYEIVFVPDGDGYRIDGKLVGVEVEAPPAMQALAALERDRKDTGMFPMRLDSRGMLLAAENETHSEAVRQAGIRAGLAIDTLGLPPFDRAQAKRFASYFETQSIRTPWPIDLFNPTPGKRESTRTLPMPNGVRGTVSETTKAQLQEGRALLASFVRKVTSEIDGDRRVTEETWTLAPKE